MDSSVCKRVKGSRVSMLLAGVLLIIVVVIAGLALVSLTASRPANLGTSAGRLAECPSSPNCVSTQTDDTSHWIEPFTFSGDSALVIPLLRKVVETFPRANVVSQTPQYLHVEFRSRLFRFVDDVEFLVEPESSRIHFRSASRVGHSDMGVNRARMEQLRRAFQKLQQQSGNAAKIRKTSESASLASKRETSTRLA